MSRFREMILPVGIATALVLWFIMFSPWTQGSCSFWAEMSCSAVILSCISIYGIRKRESLSFREFLFQLGTGIAIALILWGIFWAGDKLSRLMFDFAGGQIENVYGMKEGTSPTLIAALLLCLIGPAEEIFWRGFVQGTFSERIGPDKAFVVTTLIYALAHIWSLNFMLIMAALVAGFVWGIIYRIKPSLLPALIISHAVWDALVFVILPV